MSIDVDQIPWPAHKSGLIISHNDHHAYYETAEQAIGDNVPAIYHRDEFPDEAEIARCIATDSVWRIQWYPDTPVAFRVVCAATLGRALQDALRSPPC